MERRSALRTLIALGVLAQRASAQESSKPVRIGWITAQTAASLAPYVDAFRAALADLGYVEGRNLTIAFRYGDDAVERVPPLARELAAIPVDVLVAQGAAAFEIRNLGLSVPIVYTMSADPVSAGFADTLAHPRGNMTGVSLMAVELNGKRLDLLRQIIPGLRRVAIVGNPEHPGSDLERAFSDETGKRFGVRIDYFPTRTREELLAAFPKIATRSPQAISLLADGFAVQNRDRIIEFAMSQRVPVISGWPIFATSGALCTYGPRLTESYRRLAYYVDRILKGAKPSDLPIERPTTFDLVINLKTARILHLTVPPSVLVQADEVIE